jgi:hypothetical protein
VQQGFVCALTHATQYRAIPLAMGCAQQLQTPLLMAFSRGLENRNPAHDPTSFRSQS